MCNAAKVFFSSQVEVLFNDDVDQKSSLLLHFIGSRFCFLTYDVISVKQGHTQLLRMHILCSIQDSMLLGHTNLNNCSLEIRN